MSPSSPVLYSAITFLSASILTCHCALPLGATFLPLAGAATFAYYLPHLSANICAYVGALEDEHLPALEYGADKGGGGAVGGLQLAMGLHVGEVLGVSREVGGGWRRLHEVMEDLKAKKKKDN
ncbi:hypothetical protein B0H14DRAFT_3445878 [Mycena olivaceomarginata]|nr:hypothetical protein B0H14DRAFT_3445878 [Mycena olivaceomarginata]